MGSTPNSISEVLPLRLAAEEAIELGLGGEDSFGEKGCDITESRVRIELVARWEVCCSDGGFSERIWLEGFSMEFGVWR